MTDQDKAIQQMLDRAEGTLETDPDVTAYRTLYEALAHPPVLHFSDDFADRVVARTQSAAAPARWSAAFMAGCVAVALLASGLAIYRIDPLIFWKLTHWMLVKKELIGFGVGLFAAIQLAERWLLGRAR